MRADWAPSLEDLDLTGHVFGDAGAAALARGSRLKSLKCITLRRTQLTVAGLRPLLAAYSRQLECLQLAFCPLNDDGAELIAAAEWASMAEPTMTEPPSGGGYLQRGLFLARCGITDRGIAALARSRTIPRSIPDLFLGQPEASPEIESDLRAKFPHTTFRY